MKDLRIADDLLRCHELIYESIRLNEYLSTMEVSIIKDQLENNFQFLYIFMEIIEIQQKTKK